MGTSLTPERIRQIRQVIARDDLSRSQQAELLGVHRGAVRDYVTRFGGRRRGPEYVPPKRQPRPRGELARLVYGTDRLEDLAWGVTFTPPEPQRRA